MARRTVTTTPRSAGGQVTAAPAAPRTVPTAVSLLLEPALALLLQAQGGVRAGRGARPERGWTGRRA